MSPFFAYAVPPTQTLLAVGMKSPRLATIPSGPVATAKVDPNIGRSHDLRIGIVGGGICGTSVAHALAKHLRELPALRKQMFQITVLEGDPHSPAANSSVPRRKEEQPKWGAAAARNANSIVPGASMHVFSRRSALWQILFDTVEEWYFLQREWLQNRFSPDESLTRRQEDFAVPPPYFALHPWKCLGPSATNEERTTFLRFAKQFLSATLRGDAAAEERGSYMCELAKANRDIFLQVAQQLNESHKNTIQYTQGFLSLYRTEDAAKQSLEASFRHGEEGNLLTWKQAVALEPHLDNLPVKPLHAVYRPGAIISSCEEFMRAWTQYLRKRGVQFQSQSFVDRIEAAHKSNNTGAKETPGRRYRVTLEDGTQQEFDILVLAAGIRTPLLASQLNVGHYTPTYPLRGFSLTTVVPHCETEEGSNLLKLPFSVDSMYCTSVTPRMARWAGFGEFVGYPGKDESVASIGPTVMARYSKAVIPNGALQGCSKHSALACFRPTSPDDFPIVGGIPKLPGLYLHTGHGTLGWTTGLATGECLAQMIAEDIENVEDKRESRDGHFHFDNGRKIERQLLSPTRFVG